MTPHRTAAGTLLESGSPNAGRPSADARALRPCPAPAGPRRAVAPVGARLLPGMVGVELAARGLVLQHRLLAPLDRPVILLALPAPVPRIFDDGDAREIDRAAAAGMIAAILHVEDDATRIRIDDVPLVRGVDLPVLLH